MLMKVAFPKLWVLVLLLLPVALSSQENEDAVDYKPVKQVAPLETTLPQELKHLGIVNPRVRFHVVVGEDGEITDFLAVSATHVDLLPRAEEKLLQARFKPATEDGTPVSGKITVTISFYDPEQRAWKQGFAGAAMGGSVSDAVEGKLYSSNPDAFALRDSNPKDLDNPLKLVEFKLYRLHAPDAEPPIGSVRVEYFIDHHGEVRLPKILKSDNEYLSLSAIMSLREARFSAPTYDGRPTYVKVRQTFNFD